MICLYVHGSYWRLAISELGCGMGGCDYSVVDRKYRINTPLWFGGFQQHRPCRQQPCQRLSWLPRSRSDSDSNSQIV